jgi:hypothetical protein
MRSSPTETACGKNAFRLRADVPKTLGSAGIGVIPAISRRWRRTGPCRCRSGRNEADSCTRRDRAAGTPSVGGAYVAGTITRPNTGPITRRPHHGGASDRSHAAARTARNSAATPHDNNLLHIRRNEILKFRSRHRTAQRICRDNHSHCCQRRNYCGNKTFHDGAPIFLIQKPGQPFRVRTPFCAFCAVTVEMIQARIASRARIAVLRLKPGEPAINFRRFIVVLIAIMRWASVPEILPQQVRQLPPTESIAPRKP